MTSYIIIIFSPTKVIFIDLVEIKRKVELFYEIGIKFAIIQFMMKQKVKNFENFYAAKLSFILSIVTLSKIIEPSYCWELDWESFLN